MYAFEHCYQMNYIRSDSWGIESKTKTVNCVNVFYNECQFDPNHMFPKIQHISTIDLNILTVPH